MSEASDGPARDAIDDDESVRPGRTLTALDDVLTRVVGRLPVTAALLLAVAIYIGVGLVLPLAIGARHILLIGLNVIGAISGWTVMLAWLFPFVEARVRRQLLEQTSNLRLLSARQFEQLVAELFRREGCDQVEETGGHGYPDGGVDLRVRQDRRLRLVQCKRWDSRPVGVDEVRQLGGVLLREGLSGEDGILVALSEFTDAATTEAASLRIELVDGRKLAKRLQAVGADELLRSDTSDSPFPCPECGRSMIPALSPHGYWLHCPRYRNGCAGKRDLGREPRRALEVLIRSR